MDGQPHSEITISFDVACFPEHGDTWETVLHVADVALMQAKRTRDRSMIYGTEDESVQQKNVGT